MFNKPISHKATQFTESVIREMTRLALQHGAINLSQGFPDFPAPDVLKKAAADAIFADVNQYAITWGAPRFRNAIAEKTKRSLGIEIDPEREITVCCGSTEGMLDVLMAVINPGDEVIVFEPFYENYGPDTIISGATPRYVQLRAPDWSFDPAELEGAFNNRTKAIIINTPNNPTGKVFSRTELEIIARLCMKWDVLAITDEIYEHIIYDGSKHISPVTLDGMRERTIVVNGMSKTYSVTGWRVGYIVAPAAITGPIRKMHDFMTVGAPAPLQEAGTVALRLPDSYYGELAAHYTARRDRLFGVLKAAGLEPFSPMGAYYIMCNIAPLRERLGLPNDVEFTRFLVTKIGVAAVPGSSFFRDASSGKNLIRFTFCKKEETLEAAAERLSRLQQQPAAAKQNQA
jgi:aspartate/methionine/tyrosine aminotransferase